MAPQAKYVKDEKVLCFHGNLIYNGKCLDADPPNRYLVHYAGWNKKWDEWVTEDRLLKYNESNLKKQQDILDKHMANVDKSALMAPSANRARGQYEEIVKPISELRFKLPEVLKEWLLDDWDAIKNQHKLAVLPARYTVTQLLDNYLANKRMNERLSQDVDDLLVSVTSGIKRHFNQVLGSQLLYKFEQIQYKDVQEDYPGCPLSDIYGAIHLLRFFSKIEPFLAQMALELETLAHTAHIRDFLKFLLGNRVAFFVLSDYRPATPEYRSRVKYDAIHRVLVG